MNQLWKTFIGLFLYISQWYETYILVTRFPSNIMGQGKYNISSKYLHEFLQCYMLTKKKKI